MAKNSIGVRRILMLVSLIAALVLLIVSSWPFDTTYCTGNCPSESTKFVVGFLLPYVFGVLLFALSLALYGMGEAEKTLPRAPFIGVLSVLGVYLLLCFCFVPLTNISYSIYAVLGAFILSLTAFLALTIVRQKKSNEKIA